ncbi:hypothetical protein, partial [Adlercreutzia mucosicola]|uniref:hypothetical protein n=1 Tax=Adlercreutzia mucosicola TaxID=580026 RepID=UPI001F2FCE09
MYTPPRFVDSSATLRVPWRGPERGIGRRPIGAAEGTERRRSTMKERRQGSLLRLGLAAALACGMMPAAA